MVSQPEDRGLSACCCCTVSSAHTGRETAGFAGVATARCLRAAGVVVAGFTGCAGWEKPAADAAKIRLPARNFQSHEGKDRRAAEPVCVWQGKSGTGAAISVVRVVTSVWSGWKRAANLPEFLAQDIGQVREIACKSARSFQKLDKTRISKCGRRKFVGQKRSVDFSDFPGTVIVLNRIDGQKPDHQHHER